MFDLKGLGDQFDPMVVAGVKAYMRTDPAERARYLYAHAATARELMRLALEVGPAVFPGVDRETIYSVVRRTILERLVTIAEEAGLDAHNSETYIATIQRAFDEATMTPDTSTLPAREWMATIRDRIRATVQVYREIG
ncbi:hypothetical protein ACYOEI_22625 [Singulisphaera rosea]